MRLKISATDLETSITVYIGSKVEQDGAITIPAKLFKELVGTLSRERVDFRVDAAYRHHAHALWHSNRGAARHRCQGVPAHQAQ